MQIRNYSIVAVKRGGLTEGSIFIRWDSSTIQLYSCEKNGQKDMYNRMDSIDCGLYNAARWPRLHIIKSGNFLD